MSASWMPGGAIANVSSAKAISCALLRLRDACSQASLKVPPSPLSSSDHSSPTRKMQLPSHMGSYLAKV